MEQTSRRTYFLDFLYLIFNCNHLLIDDEVLDIPWVAVADLLVSSLCDEVGHELYEMDLAVRNVLLSRLQEDKRFGQQRINELSNFLIEYVRQKLESDDPDIRDFAQTQQWTALAYTHPNKVAYELALEFENLLNHKDTAGLLRMASLTEIFTEPLADFQPLLIYARGMRKFVRGDLKAAAKELSKVSQKGDVIRVAGVSLPIPEEIKPNQKKQTFIRRLLLKIPLARVASVAGMIVTTLLSAGVGFGVYQWSTPCSASENKVFGFFCVVDQSLIKISRGDRTLFPDIKNSDRDKGFDSFKRGRYGEAEELFKKAFADKNNLPDPEVLIYQNNARAIQQGNPFTLAAVVPATNRTDLALEMLRGIAQAQNLFNQQGRFNGRLLEIVIADDENKGDIAKLVAEELVKDESLLGIIGHSSSHVTQEALNTYEKAKLPVISPTSTSTKLQQSKFFFRTTPSDEATARKLTEYALKEKINKVLIFCNPKDPYSDSIREEFRTQFENGNKGKIFEKPCIDIADPDFNEYKIKVLLDQYQPQAILLFPDTQHLTAAITTIKARKEWLDNIEPKQRPDIKLLGGYSLYSNRILQEAGDAVEGLVVVVPWFRNAVKSISFTNAAEKQWGVQVGWYTASSFDATQVFIESFKLSPNPSKSTVLSNLPKVRLSPENTSGEEVTFDRNTREMKRDEKLLKVENGKFVVMPEAH